MTKRKVLLGIGAAAIAVLMIAGMAVAATGMVIAHHGSVQVVQTGGTGGGGNGGTPVPSYTFAVYDAVTGGNVLADGDTSYMSLGTINVNSFTEKTVYIQRTSSTTFTVVPSLTGLGGPTGIVSFTPPNVLLTDATRQPITIRFTSGNTTVALDDFIINYTATW